MKVCVFVDGENFRHSIGDLFTEFQKEDYLPKQADWTELFDWIVKSVCDNGERLRTYWYVIEQLDFFPYYFPMPSKSSDSSNTNMELRSLLSRHKPYKAILDPLDEANRLVRMTEMVNVLLRRQETLRKRFAGWNTLQDGITLRHRSIEFRRSGALTCNLFENRFGREKGVDVSPDRQIRPLRDGSKPATLGGRFRR